MKRICIYLAFSGLLAACGGRDSPSNPAESLPNRDVPVDDSAENYSEGARLEAGRAGCQGSLGVDAQGRLQACCTPETGETDVKGLAIPGRENCREDFVKLSAACTVSTDQGEKEGELWACDTAETASRDEPAPEIVDPVWLNTDPSIVHTSGESNARRLHPTGLLLGKLPKDAYLDVQQRVVGSRYPACNFFLITALCESGYCERSKPFYVAAEFDSYFFKEGWRLVKLEELKKLFKDRVAFDSAVQKDNPVAGRPGHVMVPLGLDAAGDVVVAQGNLGTVTNEIKRVSDAYLTSWQGGFNIFVKQ